MQYFEDHIYKLDAILKYVPYEISQYCGVREFIVTPKIKLYDEEILCPEQAVVLENIRDCEK